MKQSLDAMPSPAAGLLQLARLKTGMSQRRLAELAGVSSTMISAYERDLRQPTLPTLLRLLKAAGMDLRIQLVALAPHDDLLVAQEMRRTPGEKQRLDLHLEAWRRAEPAAAGPARRRT